MTLLPQIPDELTTRTLRRLGEGIGKVVYASENWVVRRDRSPAEIIALILLWRWLRWMESFLPGSWGRRFRDTPSRQIRFLRVLVQGAVLIVPRALWYGAHSREIMRTYHRRSVRGERLAQEWLTGTELTPERISFPPTRVRIGGWPGWLVISEAVERVDETLHAKLVRLAREDQFEDLERWLDRLLQTRRDGWRRGLFSLDAHLKNFGTIGERVVLLDAGGLTDRWNEVERYLESQTAGAAPHARLGLGAELRDHPEIAERFDANWKATVNLDVARACWPA